ncbi:MAG: hypothetical protein EPN48_17705 [Microbacteriaceae bacterium]|nr:MAG: hypothetical protein EPN48_17705 [Microbacteriaceae bacterium]
MSNSAEQVVRRFYQAVADFDLGVAESCFAPDALWHLPGDSPIAGDHHGWLQIRDDFLAPAPETPVSDQPSGKVSRTSYWPVGTRRAVAVPAPSAVVIRRSLPPSQSPVSAPTQVFTSVSFVLARVLAVPETNRAAVSPVTTQPAHCLWTVSVAETASGAAFAGAELKIIVAMARPAPRWLRAAG